ncbi:MAG: hypothetical protein HY235_19435 [Acidobacteria bacterium]|nr:hypothetical protein [Acidobacteriota bacterium]
MKIRLDPWPADYESPIAFDDFEQASGAQVDLTVETAHWRAVRPPPADEAACCFVDGVRRVDARILGDDGGRLVHGLYGSLAAGFVEAAGNVAEFGEIRVERRLILGNGQKQSATVRVGGSPVVFEAHSSPQNSPDAMLAELQSRMRTAEARLAESLASTRASVFVDGLSYRSTGRHQVVGIVKRIVEPYLGAAEFALVGRLRTGERTPVFAILDGNYNRYSWFLRLAEPRVIDHPLCGVVRLETGAAIGIERARGMADLAAGLLPRFASSPPRDPRAPQNLLPVGALEHEMRRRLGDAETIRRGIEKELYEQGNW